MYTMDPMGDYTLNLMAPFVPRAMMRRAANVASTVLVSKSVHDPFYADVLEEEINRLSRGNAVEQALATAIAEMRGLAGAMDPETIEVIPREIEGSNLSTIAARIGNGCRMLNEPLLTFVFTAYNESGVGNFAVAGNFLALLTRNYPWLSRILSKVVEIAVASEILIALGNTIDTVKLGRFNINAVVIALICLIIVVLMSG